MWSPGRCSSCKHAVLAQIRRYDLLRRVIVRPISTGIKTMILCPLCDCHQDVLNKHSLADFPVAYNRISHEGFKLITEWLLAKGSRYRFCARTHTHTHTSLHCVRTHVHAYVCASVHACTTQQHVPSPMHLCVVTALHAACRVKAIFF